MIAASPALSYPALLAARVALGAVTATAGPTVASLVGDFFPARERARLYGYILAGELLGTGAGHVVSANLAVLLSWRVSFGWLAVPGLLPAWRVVRLPEPERGGRGQLPCEPPRGVAARRIEPVRRAAPGPSGRRPRPSDGVPGVSSRTAGRTRVPWTTERTTRKAYGTRSARRGCCGTTRSWPTANAAPWWTPGAGSSGCAHPAGTVTRCSPP
ncbi:MFS transporter [Streptomyces sp. NPDC004561]